MSKKITIQFEKWRDPFGHDMDTNDVLNSKIVKKAQRPAYNDGYSEDVQEEPIMPRPAIQFMTTPMGMVPILEHTQPDKVFNFWVGHTNFNISKSVRNIIKGIDGVETLNVFTRYRFRIGIGKVFKDGEVMRNIRTALSKHVQQQSI